MTGARRGWRLAGGLAAGLAAIVAGCAGGGDPAPSLVYAGGPVLARTGEQLTVSPTVNGGALGFSIEPALPAGLALDPDSGVITGAAAATAGRATYIVRATVREVAVAATLDLAVGEALPAAVAELAAGFQCTQLAALPNQAAKLALAPDGRAFFTELTTGAIRVIDASGDLLGPPFATVPVLGGGHLGLLGVAVSPDFATDGFVFAYACTPAGGGKPDRGRLLRWRAVADTGTDETVLLDDLPVDALDNGGALCFDADGMLLLSVGDCGDPLLAQSDSHPEGKILRIRPSDGGVPADNPDPASHVYAKGLRNTFAVALHPTVGNLFLADNGPTTDDELNLLQAGRNYEWGGGGASFGAVTGAILRVWHDVVAPTGLAFQDPVSSGWPDPYGDSLYLTYYEEQLVERFEMSGVASTDIDREVEFLRFSPSGTDNVPVDVQRAPDGALWVLTFTGVFRVDVIR